MSNTAPDTKPVESAHSSVSESGLYDAYGGFARTLRTWFIAYGVGAPVLFLSNDGAWKALQEAGCSREVTWRFLIGVSLQIVAAIIYKTAMWYLYVGELEILAKSTWRYRASEFLSEAFWLEAAFDLLTLFFFGSATVLVLQALVP